MGVYLARIICDDPSIDVFPMALKIRWSGRRTHDVILTCRRECEREVIVV